MGGNLTAGGELRGTWLKATDITDLGNTADKVAVINQENWIYYRTMSELLKDMGINDYIVEQGTSGGWTYQKYASGYADLWWRGDVTVTSYTAVGGGSMVYTNIFNLTMPFGVTGNVVVTGAGDNLHIVCNTSWNFANKTVYFRLLRAAELKLGPQTVCLRVTGKWSTGQ